jgi:hypothetical protein
MERHTEVFRILERSVRLFGRGGDPVPQGPLKVKLTRKCTHGNWQVQGSVMSTGSQGARANCGQSLWRELPRGSMLYLLDPS